MKTLLILMVNILVLFSTKGFSQVKYLEYDFFKDTIKTIDSSLSYNTTYRIKIFNLNKKFFKVTNNTVQTDYNTEMPAIFKGIKLPTNLNLGLPEADKEEAQNSNLAEGDTLPLLKELNKLKKIETNYKNFLKLKELDNNVNNLYENCSSTYDKIEENLISQINNYTGGSDKIRKDAVNTLNTFILSYIDESIKIKESLIETTTKIKALVSDSISAVTKSKMENKQKVEEIKKIKNPDTLEKKKLKNAKSFFTTDSINIISLTILNDSLKNINIKADSMVTPMKTFKEENKIHALINNCNMINESNFTYIGPDIKLKSDELNIDLNIKSDVLLPCDKQSEIWIKSTYKTKGGVKVDFSSGLFINGGKEDFLGRDLQYEPSKTNDTTVYIKTKNGGNRALLSIGALMHIYCRSGKNLNWAISPGLSTTTGFDGLNFHLGGTVLFGGKNRLGISIGLTFREVKILDRNYNEETLYEKKKLPETPPTLKVFPRTGGFLALTYNFSKFKTE